MEARVKSVVNDNIWDQADIQWKGNCYEVNKVKEKPYDLCEGKAPYSTALLYFQNPANYRQVFSESYAKFVPLAHAPDNTYKLKLPSGNENIYTYNSQGLQKAVINDAIVQLTFLRK